MSNFIYIYKDLISKEMNANFNLSFVPKPQVSNALEIKINKHSLFLY